MKSPLAIATLLAVTGCTTPLLSSPNITTEWTVAKLDGDTAAARALGEPVRMLIVGCDRSTAFFAMLADVGSDIQRWRGLPESALVRFNGSGHDGLWSPIPDRYKREDGFVGVYATGSEAIDVAYYLRDTKGRVVIKVEGNIRVSIGDRGRASTIDEAMVICGVN